jgi:uncharacterized protein (DUF305 family)
VVRRSLLPLLLLLAVLTGCAGAVADGFAAGPGDGPRVVVPGAPGEAARVVPADEALERMTPQPVSPADVAFVAGMVPHHRQALEMAALAPDRAADPQVRAIAERITAAQGPEIAALEGWLDARADDAGGAGHGSGHTDHGGVHPGMATPEQMAALAAASGPEFDALFLQMMITHHEGALQMADERRAGGGTDAQAELMADDVAVTQTAEIERMRVMQAA